eukprot:7926962-Pyramimonas_sp.AAC.1
MKRTAVPCDATLRIVIAVQIGVECCATRDIHHAIDPALGACLYAHARVLLCVPCCAAPFRAMFYRASMC